MMHIDLTEIVFHVRRHEDGNKGRSVKRATCARSKDPYTLLPSSQSNRATFPAWMTGRPYVQSRLSRICYPVHIKNPSDMYGEHGSVLEVYPNKDRGTVIKLKRCGYRQALWKIYNSIPLLEARVFRYMEPMIRTPGV